jgi:N-dimethylarginine dimethylaminohydrolase
MAGGNPSKLKPCTPENARERQLKSAEKRKENNAKKKLMSQIYAEFLEREYSVKVAEGTKKISGAELVNEAMKKIIARGDSSSVAVMREIRETLEGQKINLSGELTTLQTTEERLAEYKKLIGEK